MGADLVFTRPALLLSSRPLHTASGAAVSTISKESTIQSAARLMMTNKIGSIIVTDKGGDFQGIITERDLLKVADGTVERQSAVGEIMTGKAKILHCKRGDTVFAVMTLINSNNSESARAPPSCLSSPLPGPPLPSPHLSALTSCPSPRLCPPLPLALSRAQSATCPC